MFGVSFSELFIVLLILIVFFRPKEIVEIIQKIILYYETLKDEICNIKSDIILLEDEDIKSFKENTDEFENKNN